MVVVKVVVVTVVEVVVVVVVTRKVVRLFDVFARLTDTPISVKAVMLSRNSIKVWK